MKHSSTPLRLIAGNPLDSHRPTVLRTILPAPHRSHIVLKPVPQFDLALIRTQATHATRIIDWPPDDSAPSGVEGQLRGEIAAPHAGNLLEVQDSPNCFLSWVE